MRQCYQGAGFARRRSHSAGFPLKGAAGRGFEEIAVVRCLAPTLGLIAILAPVAALAQVNIDQNKSPAQLYAGDCAACHKSLRGLANGRSASSLAGFLTEHYTASSREAAAIAAYVMASGGGAGNAARVQPEGKPPGNSAPGARRPEPERRAAVEPGQPGQPGSARGPVAERHERGATRIRARVKPVEAAAPVPPPPAPEAKTAVVAAPPPAESAAPAP